MLLKSKSLIKLVSRLIKLPHFNKHFYHAVFFKTLLNLSTQLLSDTRLSVIWEHIQLVNTAHLNRFADRRNQFAEMSANKPANLILLTGDKH